MPTVLILNGPNLNMLGEREPEKYGRETLADVEASCRAEGEMLGVAIDFRQTNSEGRLIGWIQESCRQMDGIVINPAGYSHTSVALADALRLVAFPVLEVHITNIHARESFRHHSFVSAVADGVIAGFGTDGYLLALRRMARLIGDKR